jgi:hypothetical protein
MLLAMEANVNARNYSGLSAIAESRLEMENMKANVLLEMESMKANILLEGAKRIQQCIDLVRQAGGVDDLLQEDDLPYYQNIDCREPSLIETGCFLPLP